jgi:hypothetical protein
LAQVQPREIQDQKAETKNKEGQKLHIHQGSGLVEEETTKETRAAG